MIEDSKSTCLDCEKDTFLDWKDYYMVNHNIWKAYGVGDGLLCMDCIEKRLGRKLTKEDILDCILTRVMNPYTKEILEN